MADDQIYEKYQAKAISEIDQLGHEIAESLADRHPGCAAVIGSGHPLADIVLIKYAPQPAEVQEGVAFFGRTGQAVLKSLQRLRVDPLLVYGTGCLKAAIDPDEDDGTLAREWLSRELHITQPRIVVVMGEDAREFLDSIRFPLASRSSGTVGAIERWTPTIELLAVPDIDRSLNDSASKQAFWTAFRVLGEWYENLPVLSGRRGVNVRLLAAALVLFCAVDAAAPHLPEPGHTGQLAFLALVSIPLATLVVYALAGADPAPVRLAVATLACAVAAAVSIRLGYPGTPATAAKLVAAACIGVALAGALRGIAELVGIALVVAVVDIYSVAAGPTHEIVAHHPGVLDDLALNLRVLGPTTWRRSASATSSSSPCSAPPPPGWRCTGGSDGRP